MYIFKNVISVYNTDHNCGQLYRLEIDSFISNTHSSKQLFLILFNYYTNKYFNTFFYKSFTFCNLCRWSGRYIHTFFTTARVKNGMNARGSTDPIQRTDRCFPDMSNMRS